MIATLRESKARLGELVARAQTGEDVVITVHGEPRARLTAIHPDSRSARTRWAALLRRLQRKYAARKPGASADSIVRELREDRT
jgi:prevent-host-death family protein